MYMFCFFLQRIIHMFFTLHLKFLTLKLFHFNTNLTIIRFVSSNPIVVGCTATTPVTIETNKNL
jgi:hypothetical protein